MYQVVIEKQAQKQLAKIPPPFYNNIAAALKDLSADPQAARMQKVERPTWL
jgi:mRNA-degrading endonuclease RelE of RelBE toxin-antitoxin system